PSINRANEADSGGHVSLGAKCQAPIRSRRRSSGGGGRHNIRRSDHLVDRKSMSQPVASPRTNRSGRTSPPRETLSVRKTRGRGYVSVVLCDDLIHRIGRGLSSQGGSSARVA